MRFKEFRAHRSFRYTRLMAVLIICRLHIHGIVFQLSFFECFRFACFSYLDVVELVSFSILCLDSPCNVNE